MYFSNLLVGTIVATLGVVSAVPSAPCNSNSGASYYCEGPNFYACQTSTSKWLLQNICSGSCCSVPAYAAFCPNCGSQPTTSKTTSKSTTSKTTSKPTTSKTTSKPTAKPTSTTTTSNKPDPTVAPGANCLVNGRYGCSGSNFLVCQDGKWAVQNNCGGTCCSVFQYAQYCYNC
ncbi:hypothetical protein K7432_010654 [Basidiobolus ranarum]|uniref:Uncharacterized protein n=1 Tax=Basidiobolus ranarum TaxID=34480 RepID=A0ABR2WNH5_9FUNG